MKKAPSGISPLRATLSIHATEWRDTLVVTLCAGNSNDSGVTSPCSFTGVVDMSDESQTEPLTRRAFLGASSATLASATLLPARTLTAQEPAGDKPKSDRSASDPGPTNAALDA